MCVTEREIELCDLADRRLMDGFDETGARVVLLGRGLVVEPVFLAVDLETKPRSDQPRQSGERIAEIP